MLLFGIRYGGTKVSEKINKNSGLRLSDTVFTATLGPIIQKTNIRIDWTDA